MLNQKYDANICVMTKIFERIGGKWKPIILYLIQHNINRFGSLQKSMPSISKKVLTHQLRELEADGLISRHVHIAKAPQVVYYHLTSNGAEVRKLIDAMIYWGVNYFRQEYPAELLKEFTREAKSQMLPAHLY